ncbi:MAG: hydrogenase maturation nickel metallochaperone HypA [Actinobacteria bacterium]|nr:hydrogenase maturation nickel metallochaperone HypA [Actinomycetota bacterium]
MHESGLVEAIVDSITNKAKGRPIVRAKVRIGMLLRAEEEAMQQAYSEQILGGVLEGSRLELDFVPGSGVCFDCGAEVAVTEPWQACPQCESGHLHAPDGEDLILEEVEYRAPRERAAG